jgi:hypothetical protein
MRRSIVLACLLIGCVEGSGDDQPAGDASVTTDSAIVDTGEPVIEDSEAVPEVTADGAAATCKGLGLYCGSRLGLDPTKLYECNESKLVGVARACTGTCIEVPDSDQDLCPCPNGDGRYCGDRVGGDPRFLYNCAGGKITKASECAGKCNAGGTATSDACAACPSGNGDYCGSTFGADKNKLYTCTNGVLSVKADCGAECVVKPPGTPDVCPACPSGDGKYCGGPVGLDPNTLYQCTGGVFTVAEKCTATCYVAPPGSPDYCTTPAPPGGTGLLCANTQWWNSPLTYGPYMSYGWWDTDISSASGSKIQLRHDSKLYKHGVYAWGWMPEFVDQVTGHKFRFLHLRPSAQYTTEVGKVYPAGTIVGLSGGDTKDTGYSAYSTGAHLCVQTLVEYRTAFPAGKDACK